LPFWLSKRIDPKEDFGLRGLKAIKQSTLIVGADLADGKTFPLLHKKVSIVNDML